VKKPKLWMATLGFLGALPLLAAAQGTGPGTSTPQNVSVSAASPQRLFPGQGFNFQLRFDPAPSGYGQATIWYRFHRVDAVAPESANPPLLDDWLLGVELHNGQAIYTIGFTIYDRMSPGKWKLVEVFIGVGPAGREFPTPVPIADEVEFEIPQFPPLLVHAQPPEKLRGGRAFTLKVAIDNYGKVLTLRKGCALTLSGSLRPSSFDGRSVPDTFQVPVVTSSVKLDPDQRLYAISWSLDSYAPAGPWRGELQIFPERAGCRSPELEGDLQFALTVDPAPNVVIPTSVAVTVNPSQVQLLLAVADRLKARAQQLKQQLSSEGIAANQALLRNSLFEALADVDSTEAAYKQREREPSAAHAVNVFFDDIRLTYGDALKAISDQSAKLRHTGTLMERVSAFPRGSSLNPDPASEAVLASILHAARACEIVASLKEMTFNLDVFSNPKGATISYRLRGEEYHPLDHETDWRIENLPRAVYLIRLQKQGYEDKEVTFDAIDSTSTSIDILLRRRTGVR